MRSPPPCPRAFPLCTGGPSAEPPPSSAHGATSVVAGGSGGGGGGSGGPAPRPRRTSNQGWTPVGWLRQPSKRAPISTRSSWPSSDRAFSNIPTGEGGKLALPIRTHNAANADVSANFAAQPSTSKGSRAAGGGTKWARSAHSCRNCEGKYSPKAGGTSASCCQRASATGRRCAASAEAVLCASFTIALEAWEGEPRSVSDSSGCSKETRKVTKPGA
mmetsp:Transcript_119937/g.384035  ORF Transcript_119937/g.384035 Transcript_119937/m.384035 type:complete len:217 (-) Transcript_119937:940-1590(-)